MTTPRTSRFKWSSPSRNFLGEKGVLSQQQRKEKKTDKRNWIFDRSLTPWECPDFFSEKAYLRKA